MKLAPTLFLLITLFLSSTLNAQTKKDSIQPRLHWNFAAGSTHIYPADYFKKGSQKISHRIPDVIEQIRERYWVGYDADKALDNPLRHNALFLHLQARAGIVPGVFVHGYLLGEHRGFSYGVFNPENTIVFPQVRLEFDKVLYVFRQPFRFFGKFGYLPDDRIFEGLCIYNIDAQGIDFNVSYKKWRFQYHQVFDLVNGIGLGIDDAYDYILGFDSLNLGTHWKADLKAGYFTGTPNRPDYNGLKFSAGFYKDSDLIIYLQMANRIPNPGDLNLNNPDLYAGLLGVDIQRQYGLLKIHSKIEARIYGGAFIYPFYNFGIGWEPLKNNYFLLILTNRGMNLDVNYPTLYLYQKPHTGLIFRRNIDWWA